MAKITLDTITSSFASTSLFNTNFSAIATDLNDKVLYRDNPAGEANQMLNDLDMNSNNVLNAGALQADTLTLDGTLITSSDTTSLAATSLTYDNTTSGLAATDVQDALDEIDGDLDAHLADAVDAHDATAISYSNGSSGLTATEVNAAIDEVEARLDTAETNITSNDTQLARGDNHGKNLIINGDFSVWQRGTSDTTTTTEVFVADRWVMKNDTASTVTMAQQSFTNGQTDVPGNPQFYNRFTWLGTGGAATPQIGTRIENVRALSGEQVTISFWAKATTGFDLDVAAVQNFGTGGSPSSAVGTNFTTSQTITTSWVEYTFTVTIPSISGKTIGTDENSFTEIRFLRNAGTAADDFDHSQIQLEFGDTATDFELVSPADQLDRCLRYFERKDYNANQIVGTGQATTTATVFAHLDYYPKRSAPTITAGGSGSIEALTAAGGSAGGTLAFNDIQVGHCELGITGASGLVAGNASMVFNITSASNIDVDAEL